MNINKAEIVALENQLSWALDLINYVIRDNIEGKFATPYYSFIPIIELYNIYNFIVVINDEYTSDDFEDKHCYDVLKKIELDKKINLSLLHNPLKRMQYDQLYHDQHFQQIQRGCEGLVRRSIEFPRLFWRRPLPLLFVSIDKK